MVCSYIVKPYTLSLNITYYFKAFDYSKQQLWRCVHILLSHIIFHWILPTILNHSTTVNRNFHSVFTYC